MKKDNYDLFFKFSFLFTFSLMSVIFLGNIASRNITLKQTFKENKEALSVEDRRQEFNLEKFDVKRIKQLIEKDKLSNKEALYYKILD